MVVLDATIVNVALPDIARALEVTSNADLSWVVTGYTLTFGGFLLLGGKLADRVGPQGGLHRAARCCSPSPACVGGARRRPRRPAHRRAPCRASAARSCRPPRCRSRRHLRGGPGAQPRTRHLRRHHRRRRGRRPDPRRRAHRVRLAGAGCFFVNVPIAAVAVRRRAALRPAAEPGRERAAASTCPARCSSPAASMALVYGLVKGNELGWGSAQTVGVLALAAVAARPPSSSCSGAPRSPLVPFRLFRNRSVLGADVGSLLVGAGIFAIFFFLILWMQVVNGYTPDQVRPRLPADDRPHRRQRRHRLAAARPDRPAPAARSPARVLAGLGLVTLGLRLRARRRTTSTVVLPSLSLVALGMGITFVALTSSAVAGVAPEDAGIASRAAQRRPAGRRRARPRRPHRRQHRPHRRARARRARPTRRTSPPSSTAGGWASSSAAACSCSPRP